LRTSLIALTIVAIVAIATATPAQALYTKMWNDLVGDPIRGVVPWGEAHVYQCRDPGHSFDLVVDVDHVNLPDYSILTVWWNTNQVGSFQLIEGRGHFETTLLGSAGFNDDLYIKKLNQVILSATDLWEFQTGCP